MGRESVSYFLRLAPASEADVVSVLQAAGAELLASMRNTRVDLRLRDEFRYWIDLRVHREPEPRLEIRIALTNDQWSIRTPLERALTPLRACLAEHSLRDGAGAEVVALNEDGWSRGLEQHYGELRDEFVASVGDFTAPLSADHVYAYIHQTRWNMDNDEELAWHREREIARIEEMWDKPAPQGDAGLPDPSAHPRPADDAAPPVDGDEDG